MATGFQGDYLEIAAVFGLTPEQIKSVLAVVTKNTINWAKKQSAAGLGNKLAIPYKTVRERMRVKIKTVRGTLWYGFNPIDLKYTDPVESGQGYAAHGYSYAGAFKVDSLNGHIFERDGRLGIMKSGRYKGKMRERITKVTVPIDVKANEYLNLFSEDVQKYFMEQLFAEVEKTTGRTINRDGITLEAVQSIAPSKSI
jgi:hypothetical protein